MFEHFTVMHTGVRFITGGGIDHKFSIIVLVEIDEKINRNALQSPLQRPRKKLQVQSPGKVYVTYHSQFCVGRKNTENTSTVT